MACLESDEEVVQEQVVFDEHQKKATEFIDRLEDLLVKLQPSDSTPPFIDNHLVDWHLDFLEDSMQTIRRAVEMPNLVDTHVFTNYLDKIRSLERKLKRLRRKSCPLMTLEDA